MSMRCLVLDIHPFIYATLLVVDVYFPTAVPFNIIHYCLFSKGILNSGKCTPCLTLSALSVSVLKNNMNWRKYWTIIFIWNVRNEQVRCYIVSCRLYHLPRQQFRNCISRLVSQEPLLHCLHRGVAQGCRTTDGRDSQVPDNEAQGGYYDIMHACSTLPCRHDCISLSLGPRPPKSRSL